MANKYIIGMLILVLLASGSIYIMLSQQVKIQVDNTKSTFSVWDGAWIKTGVEYSKLYNGTRLVSQLETKVNQTINDNRGEIVRTKNFTRGSIIDTYTFDGKLKDKENFPVSHTIEIINAKGFIFQYEVNDLYYNGNPLGSIESPQTFGRNMKLEWQEGYYYSKLSKLSSGKAKLIVKYRITSDYKKINVRLFDPVSENYSEWRMYNKNLNHSGWDGLDFTILGFNQANFSTRNIVTEGGPAIAYGYVYVGNNGGRLFQLNASNISQNFKNFSTWTGVIQGAPAIAYGYVYVGSAATLFQLNATTLENVANFTGGAAGNAPTAGNGFVYLGDGNGPLHQLNASNISQEIATFVVTPAANAFVYQKPAVTNNYVYASGLITGYLYQLNASNITKQITNFSVGSVYGSSPAVANGYVYVGSRRNVTYQLNETNVSQQIANFTLGDETFSSPAVANGYVYIGCYDNRIYQLNASNISIPYANYTTGGNLGVCSPTYANGFIYIGSGDGYVYQLNASNISQFVSSFYTGAEMSSSSIAVAKDYLYFAGGTGITGDSGIVYQIKSEYISLQSNISINFTNPTPSSGLRHVADIPANVSLTGRGNDTITIYLYNTTGLVQKNTSMMSRFFVNFTSLPYEKVYYLNASINDSFGFINYTETRAIEITRFRNFNVTLNYGVGLNFTPANQTHLGVGASFQSTIYPAFLLHNNLSTKINVSGRVNETNLNITLKLGNSSNYSESVPLNTTWNIILYNLGVGANNATWIWADYNNSLRPWFPELEIRGQVT